MIVLIYECIRNAMTIGQAEQTADRQAAFYIMKAPTENERDFQKEGYSTAAPETDTLFFPSCLDLYSEESAADRS